MKTIFRFSLLIAAVFIAAANNSLAQRVIKGTVYKDGKPAAGVTVEAHRGGSMMTSFDGLYQVPADAKSKYIKFTLMATDESKRLDLEGKTGDVFDFYFDDKKPAESNGQSTAASGGISLKSRTELLEEKNEDYANELSMYDQFYKQEDYNSALPHWKKIYNNYPKSSINIYLQGLTIYKSLISKAKILEEKEKLFSDYLKIFDQRIKYFNQKGMVLGKKADAYLDYYVNRDPRPEDNEMKKIWKTGNGWAGESISELKNASEPPVVLLFIQTSIALFKVGELPKETVVKNYETAMGILNGIVAENKDKVNVDLAKQTIPYVEDAFSRSGAADCETLVKVLTPQFNEKGNDIEFIKSMLRRLQKAKCDDSELYSQATEKLYQLDPSAEAAFNMANRMVKKEDYVKAKEYYKMAIEQETDKERLSDYYLRYAYFVYDKENALAEARTLAKKSIENNPKNCDAFMLIGAIYSQASRSYGSDAFEKSTVFWVAVDYYERARASSEDCAAEAGQKAAELRRHFPSREELFFRTLKEGQGYFVGGWIGENTRVR
jgi:tetratricopeptide (TPR) repeat protein